MLVTTRSRKNSPECTAAVQTLACVVGRASAGYGVFQGLLGVIDGDVDSEMDGMKDSMVRC